MAKKRPPNLANPPDEFNPSLAGPGTTPGYESSVARRMPVLKLEGDSERSFVAAIGRFCQI